MAKSETDNSRQARLAAALRDNLKRRKAQGRARKVAVSAEAGKEAPGSGDGALPVARIGGTGEQHPMKED